MKTADAACAHDLHDPVRMGRANWHCRLCGEDISLMVVLLADAGHKFSKRKRK